MMTLPRLYFRIAMFFGMAVPCLPWLAGIGAAQNTDRPRPTYADVAYGPHERNVIDFYKVDSDKPTALLVYFHGGGWRNGSKKDLKHKLCRPVMESGIAFAAANYRLTHHAPHPAQLHDAARAIQFLRSKAVEWNIDPTRIAAYGGSAGGSISLWLALHDDMADPASDDPVARQSTRLSCAIGIGAQSTNDPRVIRKIIPGKAYNQSALKPLFGLPADWNWDTAEVSEDLSARLMDASPITHLTKDDPPIFVYHTKSSEVPGNIHHSNFGRYLKKNMDAMNIECIFRMSSDYVRWDEDRNEDFVAFLRKHFGMEDTKQLKQADSIKPYAENPRYWQYKGKPVLLLGGSKTDHIFLLDDLEPHLDEMQAVGANYVRCTMSQREGKDLKPHKLLPDGKFDLDQWNQEYWKRFGNMLTWTAEREIIVQIEVWDRFDYSTVNWETSPWNPGNNVNYTCEQTGFASEYPQHSARDLQPFFHSNKDMPRYHKKLDIIRRYQEAFVARMLSYSLDYGHVLYCMDNETSTPAKWGQYWIGFIKAKAAEKGVTVCTTDMFDDAFDADKAEHTPIIFNDTEHYMFADISQVNSRSYDETHWERLQWLLRQVNTHPRPSNHTKIYGSGYKSFGTGGPEDGVERFWRNILGGSASARFHRPDSGNGLNDLAKGSIKAARIMESLIKFWNITPQMGLLSDRESNEAYLAAKPGECYALYFTNGGSVGLDLSGATGSFDVTWISVSMGVRTRTSAAGGYRLMKKTIQGGGVVKFSAPYKGGWVAAIVKK